MRPHGHMNASEGESGAAAPSQPGDRSSFGGEMAPLDDDDAKLD